MKTITLYGYIAGHEKPTIIHNINIQELKNAPDGNVGGWMCGMDMWTEIHKNNNVFVLYLCQQFLLPSALDVLKDTIIAQNKKTLLHISKEPEAEHLTGISKQKIKYYVINNDDLQEVSREN